MGTLGQHLYIVFKEKMESYPVPEIPLYNEPVLINERQLTLGLFNS